MFITILEKVFDSFSTMSPTFSPLAATTLRNTIDEVTSGDPPHLPSVLVHLVDHDGATLYSNGSTSVPDQPTPTAASLIYLHSLTKILGAILFMRLNELSIVDLDSPQMIATYLPELASKSVLTGSTTNPDGSLNFALEPRKGDITPRMLMNHTYGGGHTYFNKLILDYVRTQKPDGWEWETANEITNPYAALLASPLAFQPNTRTHYGQGFDWLAILIERVTQTALPDLLEKHIFAPLGIADILYEPVYNASFEPPSIPFWPRTFKQPDLTFPVIDPLSLTPSSIPHTAQNTFPNTKAHIHPLGTGLLGSPSSLARILTILLPQNAGVDPITKTRILSSSSVAAITMPTLAPHLRTNRRKVESSDAVPGMLETVDLEMSYLDPEGSFGLGCGIQGEKRVIRGGGKGRSKGSVYWYGAANSEFWIDPEEGVVCVANAGFFPWNDENWVEWVGKVESIVYEGLDAGK